MPAPVFTCEFTIDYQLLAPDLSARLPGLMGCVQEASIRHTESTPHKMQWYADNARGWLLTSWHIEVVRLPRWNEAIRVATWPSRFKGILADRSFAVTDADGKRLLAAVSGWVYTDLAARRPVKPPQEVIDGYGAIGEPALDADYKFSRDGFAPVSAREMLVTRRDTDTNSHVNNLRYIEWAFDEIPADMYDTHTPRVVKASYKKECVTGDVLTLETAARAGGSPAVLTDMRKEGAVVCEVYTEWARKE